MNSKATMPEIMTRMGRLTAYAVFMRPTDRYNTESDEGRELMRRHLLFQLDLEDRGVLLAAGPIDGGGSASTLDKYSANAPMTPGRLIDASGMYFIVASSREAAEEIAASEPFEAAGWRIHTLCQWMVNEGTALPLLREMLANLQPKGAVE
jgi:hypothetical protein